MSNQIEQWEGWDTPSDAHDPGEGTNPLMLVHRCLRGRYWLAILLGAVLAVPAAIAGYIAIPPKYQSTGRVSIAPTRTPLIHQTEFNQPMTQFDSYVQSQANTLRGSRVLDLAMQDDELRKVGWPPAPQGVIDLQQGLSVVALSRQQDIFVSVQHAEPAKAKAAVNAVLSAYQKLAIDLQVEEVKSTIGELEALTRQYRSAMEAHRANAFSIAATEGTDDLARRRDAKHEQAEMLEKLMLDYEVQLVPFQNVPDDPDATPVETEGEVPVELLAQADPELATLLQQRRQANLQLQSLLQKYRDSHRSVVIAKREVETLDSMIDARADLVRVSSASVDPTLQAGSPGAVKRALQSQLSALRNLRDDAAAEAKRLGTLQLEIDKQRELADRAEKQFETAQSRLDMLQVEQRNERLGRISIAEQGVMPLSPSSDRRIPLAAMGAMGGGVFGVVLVAGLGLVFPKYRYIGDLSEATRNVFVYGAVPELDPADPESREMVAASVHQVRSVIDARLLGTSKEALVHLVTSAGAGEGKSTVSLRLAKSFAATGRRTLLIDSDMIGKRISVEFGMRDRAGFADAVTGRGASDQTIHETPIRDLAMMPCGRTDRVEPQEISARRVADLVAPLRQVYQAIVIDTGPVLGSLEAQAVSAVADEILLVVTRGREVRSVKLAIDRLTHLGAKRVGVVFNRATRQDVERSTSMSMTSERASEVRANWDDADLHQDGANGYATVDPVDFAEREN